MEVNPYQGTLAYKVNDDEMVYEITKTEMQTTATKITTKAIIMQRKFMAF